MQRKSIFYHIKSCANHGQINQNPKKSGQCQNNLNLEIYVIQENTSVLFSVQINWLIYKVKSNINIVTTFAFSLQWRIQRTDPPPPSLILDRTGAQRAENFFFLGDRPPLHLSKGWMTGPPLSQGLDPALHCMIISFNNLEIVQCIVLDLFTLKYTYTETTSNSESGFLTPKRTSSFLLSTGFESKEFTRLVHCTLSQGRS